MRAKTFAKASKFTEDFRGGREVSESGSVTKMQFRSYKKGEGGVKPGVDKFLLHCLYSFPDRHNRFFSSSDYSLNKQHCEF